MNDTKTLDELKEKQWLITISPIFLLLPFTNSKVNKLYNDKNCDECNGQLGKIDALGLSIFYNRNEEVIIWESNISDVQEKTYYLCIKVPIMVDCNSQHILNKILDSNCYCVIEHFDNEKKKCNPITCYIWFSQYIPELVDEYMNGMEAAYINSHKNVSPIPPIMMYYSFALL